MTTRMLPVFVLAVSLASVAPPIGHAQSPGPIVTGLGPLFKPYTNPGFNEILVPEAAPSINAGRVLFIDRAGRANVLISGLPSGPAAPEGDASGPTAVFLIDNTVYILIGAGNTAIVGPAPGTELLNPNPASPLFNSVLGLEVSPEGTEGGFALTAAQQADLARGTEVKLTNAKGERADIRLVVDLPNSLPSPIPGVPNNIDPCNLYAVTGSDSQLDIADAGCNRIVRVDVYRQTWRTIAEFPPQPNTLPAMGPPVVDAVPTGVQGFEGNLVVSLLTGFPFGPGAASILRVNPETREVTRLIGGLQMVTDVLVRRRGPTVSYWVLEFGAGGPGRILRFDTPSSTPIVINNSLNGPTGMSWDSHGNILVSQLNGSIVRTAP